MIMFITMMIMIIVIIIIIANSNRKVARGLLRAASFV